MKSKSSYLTKILLVLFITNSSFSQNFLSTTDFTKIDAEKLTQGEIQKIKDEMTRKNISIDVIESAALAKGMTPASFATLKGRLQSNSIPYVSNVQLGSNLVETPVAVDKESQNNPKEFRSKIFGSDLFTNHSLSFEPNSNMATPVNYILGTGDEIQIVVYGVQEFSTTAYISKDGKINIQNVGQLNINGMTFESATSLIKKSCGNVFTSLRSGQSDLSVTLTKIRTIKITIIGSKKPGTYSVSSLSTVFNALHHAGGPDDNGSYRNIELIRNNKVIRKIDIYKFITTGDQSDNVNLKENDVIRIPVYNCRVSIEGEVKKSGIFELVPGENFITLLNYCSGFTETAYLSSIKLVQNTEKELRIIDLSKSEFHNYIPKTGDLLKVGSILNRFENRISIKGAVYRPDDYSFESGIKIMDLISKADGLTEDAYKRTAQITRLKDDYTTEILSIDLDKLLNGDSSQNVALKKNDDVFVFSIFDFKDQLVVHIGGEIRNSGKYAYIENLKLFDLLHQAGGMTILASKRIEISRIIKKDELINDQKDIATIIMVEIDSLLSDESKNITLQPNDVIQIRKIPIYTNQQTVVVSGYFLFPGSYTITNNNERVMDMINRAGGLKLDANPEGVFIKRGDNYIPINYKKISKEPVSIENIRIQPGDELKVKKYISAIKIEGSISSNTEIPYIVGKSVRYYIDNAGGSDGKGLKRKIYNKYPNGAIAKTKSFLFVKIYPKVRPGSVIVIPVKPERKEISLTAISAVVGLTSTLATMVVVLMSVLN